MTFGFQGTKLNGHYAMSHEHVRDHLTSIITSIHWLKKTLDVANQVTLGELTLPIRASAQYLCSLSHGSLTLRAVQAAGILYSLSSEKLQS